MPQEMKLYLVGRRDTIENFLLEKPKKYQKDEINKLLECKAITIRRKKERIEVTKTSQQVQAGDIVIVSPQLCGDKLERISANQYRDYAFVPGKTDYEEQMQKALSLRPKTIVVTDELSKNLKDFLQKYLWKVDNPIRNLLIVSHSHPDGRMVLPMDSSDDKIITYEDLEKAVENDTLKIETKLFKRRPKDSKGQPMIKKHGYHSYFYQTNQKLPFSIHIRGCRIGAAQPSHEKSLFW